MAASQIVPLTVTYAPQSGVTSTATVLGQVLNNGATNWIPTSGNAIYLAASSEQGAEQTAVGGDTYYITTGPAVPAQATISVSPTASGGAATASSAGPVATPSHDLASSQAAGASQMSASSSGDAAAASGSASASASSSPNGSDSSRTLGLSATFVAALALACALGQALV